MASFQELAQKKVAGIPVLYLAGAFVAILAIVAWKMKPSTPEDEGPVDEEQATDIDPTDGAADYSGLATQGTVTVVQGTKEDIEAVKPTNEDWERSAVDYLVESNQATPTEAQNAIRKYLDGAALSFDEGKLKDAAIRKLKLPPEPLHTVGSVGTAPAQKQAGTLPGKHTVKGPNDNTAAKLAQLYYGSSASQYVLTISSANASRGTSTSTYPVGASINIPRYSPPRYFTVDKNTRWPSQVAKKNGTTWTAITTLNPDKTTPYAVGTKLRVA